ncbi:hypothetical protein HKD37_04G010203 [Glycine soja]
MYDYHEEERAPDLESILADFMTYQASSKGYCYFMQQQGTQFERNQSSAGYQWESYRQSDYHNKVEGILNLDDLLMKFKDIVESIQDAFRRTETQISKLVDDMTNAAARKEEERVEIEIHQENIHQVTSIYHQLTNEEEKPEVSSTPEYPYWATVGYVGGKDKGRLELSVEDQKISFDIFEATKHSDMGDACFDEEEEVEQEITLLASTMVLQSLLVKEHGYGRDCLPCDEELDDSKDSCVDQVKTNCIFYVAFNLTLVIVYILFLSMASRKRARTEDIPSSSNPSPSTTSMEPDSQQTHSLIPMLQSLFRGQLMIIYNQQELAHNRPIISMEQFLEKVAWPEAQLPLEIAHKVVPPGPTLSPPAPPLIIIPDDSADEAAAPLDSPSCNIDDGFDFSDWMDC